MKIISLKITVLLFFVYYLFFPLSSLTYASIPGCFCSASSSCYPDGCTRKTIKQDGSIDYGLCGSAGCGGAYSCCYDTNSVDVNRYFCTQQPPCCVEMVRRNDPEACCWPERGYCHPFYCNQVSRPEDCGRYWTHYDAEMSVREYGYGCTKGTSAENLQPVFGLPAGVPGAQPTTIPPTQIPPTVKPTIILPTSSIPTRVVPTVIPTRTTNVPTRSSSINPTQILTTIRPISIFPSSQIPTIFISPTNSQSPITIGIGSFKALINDSTAQIKTATLKAAIASEKILDLPSYIGAKILNLDQILELFINNLLRQIIKLG